MWTAASIEFVPTPGKESDPGSPTSLTVLPSLLWCSQGPQSIERKTMQLAQIIWMKYSSKQCMSLFFVSMCTKQPSDY